MSSAMNWRAEEQPTSDGVSAVIHLQEASLENRIETLRELALTLLEKLESLQSARPGRGEGSVKLYDEVQRFEIDLICSALDRARGNQVRAARLLGVKPTTLNAKLKRYRISLIGREVKAERDVPSHEMAA
jgi:transcriptional regulator with GAF, ATPase, and Fis domain